LATLVEGGRRIFFLTDTVN